MRFSERVLLVAMIDHKDSARHFLEADNAAEIGCEIGELAVEEQALFFGIHGELVAILLAGEVEEMRDAALDLMEVGECAADPPLGDMRHVERSCSREDDLARLMLGTHEKEHLAGLSELTDKLLGFGEIYRCFLQIDDVDSVFNTEKERLHRGVAL